MLFKRFSVRIDLLITIMNTLIVVVSILLINGLIARKMGVEILGQYLLIRRTGYSLAGFLVIGANIGLPFFISRNKSNDYGKYLYVIYVLITLPLIIIFSLLVFLDYIPGISTGYTLYIGIYLAGITFQTLSYAYYRGNFNMLGASIIQLVSIAVIPLLVILLYIDVIMILKYIGILIFLFSYILFLAKYINSVHHAFKIREFVKLLKYGLARIPGQLAQFVQLAALPLLIAKEYELSAIAYYNTGLSIVRIILVIIAPIGLVLLPRISLNISRGNTLRVKEGINILINGSIIVGILLASYIFRNLDCIIELWLGKAQPDYLQYVRVIMLSIPLYLLSGVLKSPIDAITERGLNSYINIFSAFTMILLFYILKQHQFNIILCGSVSFVVGFLIAGILSVLVCQKYIGVFIDWAALFNDFFLLILPYSLSLHMINIFVKDNYYAIALDTIILMSMTTVYILKSKSNWVKKLRSFMFHSRIKRFDE